MAPRVLLTTTVNWPSTARLAGAFANAGADVEALLAPNHIASGSRYFGVRHVYEPLFPLRALAAALDRARPDLIVPCDDRAIAQLLELHAEAPHPVIARSLGRVGCYRHLISRATFIDAAGTAGIAVPDTTYVPTGQALDAALVRIGFPAVLKADGSWGGDGVAIVRTPEEAHENFQRFSAMPSRLRSVVRAVKRRDLHFLHAAFAPAKPMVSVQQFIPGKPATTAFACWQGRVLAAIHMDVLETQDATGPACVLRRVECKQMEQAAVRLAGAFGLSGLHGLDFVRDEQGKPWLIEINPRATQSAALALGPGRDLPAALVGAVGNSVKGARPTVTENPVIALFPQEWRRNPASPWLATAHLDAPWDDPAVLRACLEPGETMPELPAQAEPGNRPGENRVKAPPAH